MPGTRLEVKLATQADQPYDVRAVEQDVRYLWSLRRFEDIRVETAEGCDHNVAVVFHTTPRRFFTIHEVKLEPNSFGLNIALPEGTRIDRERAHTIAMNARKQLQERGFLNAQVSYEIAPIVHNQVDLKLKVDPGDAVRVHGVEFTGDTRIPPPELQRALRSLRPRRWRPRPSYTQSAVGADLARLRSHYFFKGYLNSDVRVTDIDTTGTHARVKIEVQAGPRSEAVPLHFCSALLAERRAAERKGILEFSAMANVDSAGTLTWSTEQDERYRVGRIQFIGNRRHSDAFIRRNLVIDEAQPFDQSRLRQSLARLNRTNVFESIDARNVAVVRHPETGVADILIRLTERKRGSWSISGPIGPMSFAGPLQAAIGAQLPPWGRGIFELSTYTATFSVFAFARPLLTVWSLQRPYTPGEGWRSGFAIAPQLGWRSIATGYFATQLQQRLLPVLSGDRGLIPELPVTVHRPVGDTVIMCEPPAPKLGAIRNVAGLALHTLGAFSGM